MTRLHLLAVWSFNVLSLVGFSNLFTLNGYADEQRQFKIIHPEKVTLSLYENCTDPTQFNLDHTPMNPEILKKLESIVASNDVLKKAQQRGHLGIGVIDISQPRHPSWAAINPDWEDYAASTTKIATLLGNFYNYLHPTGEELRDNAIFEFEKDLYEMIAVSNNFSAGKMQTIASFKSVERALKSEGLYHWSETDRRGGMWMGGIYAQGSVLDWAAKMRNQGWNWLDTTRKRSPKTNNSAAITVRSALNYMLKIEKGMLLNPWSSRAMKAFMKDVRTSKWAKNEGMQSDDPNISWYGKTGTWKVWQSEVSIVEGANYRYIITMLTKNVSGSAAYKTVGKAMNHWIRTRRN